MKLFSFSNQAYSIIVFSSKTNYLRNFSMKDLKHKDEMIRSIEQLQLSNHLIVALEDQHQAENVVKAVNCLKDISTQWH